VQIDGQDFGRRFNESLWDVEEERNRFVSPSFVVDATDHHR